MNVISKIFNGIFIVLLLGVGGLFLASFFPESSGVSIKVVKSGSMEPAIRTGGIVVVRTANEYRVGDVITFGEDTKKAIPTTHRIVSIRKELGKTYYTTKGDANEEADSEESEKHNVIGRVVFSAPYAGFVLDFARQPKGFLLLVALPALLVIFYEIIAIRDEARKIVKGREYAREDFMYD